MAAARERLRLRQEARKASAETKPQPEPHGSKNSGKADLWDVTNQPQQQSGKPSMKSGSGNVEESGRAGGEEREELSAVDWMNL